MNGKRNGKGKLYDNDKLKYEGEFVNGKKNGKGVEYDRYREVKYEGDFLNGKKNGKGKEFVYNNYIYNYYGNKSNIIFEGEYLNNHRLKGKEYYKYGVLTFEGEYLFKNKWNGKICDNVGNVLFEINSGNGIIEDKYDKIQMFIIENLDENNSRENMKGKEYDYNGRLLFEGEYLGKEKWKGKIKEYYKNELIFE